MNRQQKYFLFLFLTTFVFSGLLHYSNLLCLKEASPHLIRSGASVSTSDDASYLSPAENWLKGEGWRSNAAGNASLTVRSPGYGLLYATFRIVLQEQNAIRALIIFQILLFSLAVAFLPHIGVILGLNQKVAFGIGMLVAVLPTFSGFLSYTLTEAITPSLVLIFLYFLLRFYRYAFASFLPAAIVLGFLLIVRPPMLIWVFSVLVFLFNPPSRQMRNKLLSILAIALAPLLIWQIFISVQTEEVQGLHPIYQTDSNDLYRPLHHSIWDYHKTWGQEGPVFNATVNALWGDALNGRNPDQTIEKIIQSSDKKAVELIGSRRLERAYSDYFEILLTQVPYNKSGSTIGGESLAEKELKGRFEEFRKTYSRTYFVKAYFLVPLEVYFHLGFHSNLSLFVFQKALRGSLVVELLRYFSFFIHFGLFILFPLAAFLTRNSVLCRSVFIPVLLYLGYLCFFQRGVEERYTLPVLVPMLLIVAAGVNNLITKHTFANNLAKSKT